MSFYGRPRCVILLCLVFSGFSSPWPWTKPTFSSMIANSNKELLYQFKALISDSISDLKRANEATASKQMQEIKRIKRDPVPQCNKRSNEDQFKARNTVTEAVEDAKAALGTKLGEKLAELAQNSALKSIRKATETNDKGL